MYFSLHQIGIKCLYFSKSSWWSKPAFFQSVSGLWLILGALLPQDSTQENSFFWSGLWVGGNGRMQCRSSPGFAVRVWVEPKAAEWGGWMLSQHRALLCCGQLEKQWRRDLGRDFATGESPRCCRWRNGSPALKKLFWTVYPEKTGYVKPFSHLHAM